MKTKTLLPFAALLTLITGCSSGPKDEKKQVPISSLKDVFVNLESEPQRFEINPDQDTLLIGKEGTAIFVPTHAFKLPEGTIPTGMISLELKECYSLSSIISDDLSTLSQGHLLQTAGMIYIKA